MNTIGPKKLFNYGIFTTGACCVLFGFLNFLEGRASFIISCFVVRTIEAVGDAAFVVASFTIIALEFPDSVATTFVRVHSVREKDDMKNVSMFYRAQWKRSMAWE